MISIGMLSELQDGDLRTTIEEAERILKHRDDERKAKAIVDARAVLEAAGLTLKHLGGNGKRKAFTGPIYHTGHTYQHPVDKTLVWNAKGKKPNWLRELEKEGGRAVGAQPSPMNEAISLPLKKNG